MYQAMVRVNRETQGLNLGRNNVYPEGYLFLLFGAMSPGRNS